MSGTHKIGIIVGEVNTSEFYFATNEDINRLEYVVIHSTELVHIAGKVQETDVEIIAQIFQVFADSRALVNDLKMEDAEKIIDAGLADARFFAKVRILGYLHQGNVYQPRRAIKPGNPVYLAPNELLAKFYSYPEEEGLYIGHLITRADVPVYISVRGFQRHASILAQTGGGKSYLTGVIVEELYRKGATIVIIDPHADYVLLGNQIDQEEDEEESTIDLIENIDRIDIFQTPNSTGRYTDADVGRLIQQYSVRFADLSIDEIFIMCGVSDRFTRIRQAIDQAIITLRARPAEYVLDDLISELTNDADNNDAQNALRYVNRMHRLRIFGDVTTPITNIIRPKHVSVIDLSGIPDYVADYIAYRILSEIYDQRRNEEYDFPVFIFIEEAHRFLPNKGGKYSINIVKEIAAEGRKFGVFQTLITQRPYKVDQDALSQCNSQLILKITNSEDQNAIKKSSEKLSEDLLEDLPGLNIGEAVIVGNLTRAPVMVRVRRRNTEEGGADLDLLAMLAAAREQANTGEQEEQEEAQQDLDDLRSMME